MVTGLDGHRVVDRSGAGSVEGEGGAQLEDA